VADQPNIPLNPTPGQQGQPATQQIQVRFDDTEMQNLYVNFFRVTPNDLEVLLDMGMHAQVIAANGQPEPIRLTHRLIMNYMTAKRLQEVLRLIVTRHEQAFGVVELDPNRRMRYGQQQPPPG
jgi:hypothetical protein